MYNWAKLHTRLDRLEREMVMAMDNWAKKNTQSAALTIFGYHSLIQSFADELSRIAQKNAEMTMENILEKINNPQ